MLGSRALLSYLGLSFIVGAAPGCEPATVPADDFCSAVAELVCETEACCDAPYPDVVACKSAQRRNCVFDVLRPNDIPEEYFESLGIHEAPEVAVLEFDEEAAATILNEIRSAKERCEPFEPVSRARLYIESSKGGPCDEDEDCVERFVCEGDRCVDPPGLNDDCFRRCAEGLVCDDTTCRIGAAESESCDEMKCAEGLACAQLEELTDAGIPTNICVPRRALGEPCGGYRVQCDRPSRCDPSTGLCAVQSASRPFWCAPRWLD